MKFAPMTIRNWSAGSIGFGGAETGFGVVHKPLRMSPPLRSLAQRQRFLFLHACLRILDTERSKVMPTRTPARRTAISRTGFVVSSTNSGGMEVSYLRNLDHSLTASSHRNNNGQPVSDVKLQHRYLPSNVLQNDDERFASRGSQATSGRQAHPNIPIRLSTRGRSRHYRPSVSPSGSPP